MLRAEEWSCAACKASGTELVPGAFRAIKSAGVMKKDSLFLYVAKLAHPQRLAGQCLVLLLGIDKTNTPERMLE
eukprot:4423131-Amphidinium_carterae.1